MLGAIIMLIIIGIFIWGILINFVICGFGGGEPFSLIFLVLCIVGILVTLWYAPQIVNLKINISF